MDNTTVDKPFWQSKTIWGNIVTFLGLVLAMFGYQIAPDAMVEITKALGELAVAAGSAYSIYGRFKAGGIYIKAPSA